MDRATSEWFLVGHLIGVFLWLGALIAVYWLLRIHTHTPKDARDQLTLMERSLAMVMDLAATVAIGCGIAMAVSTIPTRETHAASSLFTAPHAGWFHIKLTVVVLGILSVHGLVRARVARFSRGDLKKPMPAWPWSVLLLSIVAIVILVVRGPAMFGMYPESP